MSELNTVARRYLTEISVAQQVLYRFNRMYAASAAYEKVKRKVQESVNLFVSFNPMCVPSRFFRLPLLFALQLAAQQSRDLYTPPPVLARLERLQQHEDVCALIQRTGTYRLERRYAAKLEVFDGNLSPKELEEFNRILNSDELRNISRNDVPRPMIMDTIDSFLIDAYRTDGEQPLNFNSPDARKRFRSGTDPILKWFSNLPKLQHTEAADSKPSHCHRLSARPSSLGPKQMA